MIAAMSRTKSSKVWDHFNIQDDMVVCKKCSEVLQTEESSISNTPAKISPEVKALSSRKRLLVDLTQSPQTKKQKTL